MKIISDAIFCINELLKLNLFVDNSVIYYI